MTHFGDKHTYYYCKYNNNDSIAYGFVLHTKGKNENFIFSANISLLVVTCVSLRCKYHLYQTA